MTRVRHGSWIVGWDKGFTFEAVQPEPHEENADVVPASVVGAAFVCGRKECLVMHLESDGAKTFWWVKGATAESLPEPKPDFTTDLVICGQGVSYPELLSATCTVYPGEIVSVCPLVGPLPAFGVVVGTLIQRGLERARIGLFYESVDGDLDMEAQEFDMRLGADGIGRMAYLMKSGMPVLNQMMRTPCMSPFYGRIIASGKWWGEPIFLMRSQSAAEYFPSEQLSVRNFAASWAVVSVDNTDKFSLASGWGKEKVRLCVAAEYIPELPTFMKYLQSMTGKDFIASSSTKAIPVPREIPLFRYNKAYSIGPEQFRQVVRGFDESG